MSKSCSPKPARRRSPRCRSAASISPFAPERDLAQSRSRWPLAEATMTIIGGRSPVPCLSWTRVSIAYEVLEKGVAVYAADGSEVGTVDHVVAAPEEDIFHGIVI